MLAQPPKVAPGTLSIVTSTTTDSLMVPSKLARKCSIVREGEENESPAAQPPTLALSPTTVRVIFLPRSQKKTNKQDD